MQTMIKVEITWAASQWMEAYLEDCMARWQCRQEGQKVGENSAAEDMLEAWALADAQSDHGMPHVKWIKNVGKKTFYEATEEAIEAMIDELKYWEGYCADLSWAGDATPLQASSWSRSCRSAHEKMQARLDQHRLKT